MGSYILDANGRQVAQCEAGSFVASALAQLVNAGHGPTTLAEQEHDAQEGRMRSLVMRQRVTAPR